MQEMSVFAEFARLSPTLEDVQSLSYKAICALADSRDTRRAVYAFLGGCSRSKTALPRDCGAVYLVALRVAFHPKSVFKRPDGIDEMHLTIGARGVFREVFGLLKRAREAGWCRFEDAPVSDLDRVSDAFLEYLWTYLEYVELRKDVERVRTLNALAVVHNARILSPKDPIILARCTKAFDSLMPCLAKTKLPVDEPVFRQLESRSPVPLAGYPGDPALLSIPIRPFDGDRILGVGNLIYELLVDPSYKSAVASDYFDIFDESSLFSLGCDLGRPVPVVDSLLGVFQAIATSVNRLRRDAVGMLPYAFEPPSERALLDALAARGPLAPLFASLFDSLVEMSAPPHFFVPKLCMTQAELDFIDAADCGGDPLPPHAAFTDRFTGLHADWLQCADPFPAPQTAEQTAEIWVRTVRFLMWARTSLDVESSNTRIGLLQPIIQQRQPLAHEFVLAALLDQWGSPESLSLFSAWRERCIALAPDVQEAIRQGVVEILVDRSGFQTGARRVLFPSYPMQLGVSDLPLPLRFDRGRLSRIRSRLESAVTITALLRTAELALIALEPSSAAGRLHACFLSLLG